MQGVLVEKLGNGLHGNPPAFLLSNPKGKVKTILSALLKTLYPPCCLACGETTEAGAEFCANCWSEAHFITGNICDSCGVPLFQDEHAGDAHCENCHNFPPAWHKGRAVAMYDGPVRHMVLALKHGDRLDIALPAARWMAEKSSPLTCPETLIIPVPLHWRRLVMRRYNQAAVLAQKLALETGLAFLPDALRRLRATRMQKDMNREQRFKNQSAAISINPRATGQIKDRPVLIVDDVMTTGATLSACTQACLAANARTVNVIVLARVARPE
jgi:ComF family protein